MATIEDLLHHLVDHAPGLSVENRQEYHDMLNESEEHEQAEVEAEPEEHEEA